MTDVVVCVVVSDESTVIVNVLTVVTVSVDPSAAACAGCRSI